MENSEHRSNKCQQRTKRSNTQLSINKAKTTVFIKSSEFQLRNNLLKSSSLAPAQAPVKGTKCADIKGGKSIGRPLKCVSLNFRDSSTFLITLFVLVFASLHFNFGDCASAFNNIDADTKSFLLARLEKPLLPEQHQRRSQRSLANNNDNNDDFLLTKGAQLPLSLPLPLQQHHLGSRSRRQLSASDAPIRIVGIRVEDGSFEASEGVPSVLSDVDQKIRVFGTGLSKNSVIAFTTENNAEQGACLKPDTALFKPDFVTDDGLTALFTVKFPKNSDIFCICAKNDDDESVGKTAKNTKPLEHQGNNTWSKIKTHEPLMPTWLAIIVIVVCLGFSSLFSGLNLGLMSLDRTELKILRNTGTPQERKYAAKIQPVRDQGNYLLCSILLGNVLVNSTFTILLDGLTSGLIAVIFSTIAIVLFGEITPQAICSRHGLAIGAKTIYITRTVMAITAPLSYPVSKFLDLILGEEIGNVYNRERLKELVRVTTGINDLDKNEVNIISGALELRKKIVADIMTHIDDAFMLSLDAILDFETVSEIMKSGYSRIPVYDGDRKNIVTLLYIKDLAFVDTDDNTPLKTLCEFYQNPVHFVFEDYTLDIMFNQFKDGTIGHLAFVHRVNNEGDGDPFYETVGLVTLEDVIEELIQAEIVDEFDVFIDNRTKIKRNRRKQDFTAFAERRETQSIRVSPQLALATFQYLSTAVDAFKKDMISEQILRRLLNQDIFHHIKCKGKNKDDPSLCIFTQGKAVDFFVLILEGRVEVTIGKEGLMFESGPFTYFGTQALIPNVVVESPTQLKGSMQSLNLDSKIRQTFVPDYSVRATCDVIYITIKRSLYLTAKKATLLEKSRKSGTFSSETFDDEVEKLLHSITDDDKPRYIAATQSMRHNTKSNRSITSSPSNNENSPDGNSNSISPNHQTQKADTEDASVSSFVTSEIAVDLPNGEHDERDNSAASSPLLPKIDDLLSNDHKPQ